MKTSSKFLLKSFASPFVATFFICVFILLMQFVWKHIDDMVGKGLEWSVIAQLLLYVAASLVPMALPLAILLSSLMTFGNLGENYELVAFKSAGVSLKRILRPLAIVAILLSVVAFLFSNYWLPVANLKSKSLLYDVKEQKPTMDIKPGIFSSELDDFTIRVRDKKVINEVERLYDVMIYDHRGGKGNRSVIIAEEGILTLSPDKRFIELRLFNGVNYDEGTDNSNQKKYPLSTTKFKEDLFRIDRSEFTLNRTDEDLFKNNYKMLNISQLSRNIDTLEIIKAEHLKNYKEGLKLSYFLYSLTEIQSDHVNEVSGPVSFDDFFDKMSMVQKQQSLITAANLSRNSKSRVESMVNDIKDRDRYIRNHEIEWHKKLSLSFACFLLFLIGAPLGAIIRKGGLGMPLVVSVLFFLIFHILSITGEKMAAEGAIPVFKGMWLSTMVLLPVGIFFTLKATSDSALFNIDAQKSKLMRLFSKKDKK
ncbi:MAG: YjgP/YjgQ family permease [Bacteroidetes bacterium]|nr:YjgP/YjgQ family permease [Bacteroidota bacterium]